MRTYLSTLFIVVMFLGGCDILSSSKEKNFAPFTIETDQETYTSNQRVEVSFINNTKHSVLFSPCGTVLQRYNNESWSVFDAVVCVAIPRVPIPIDARDEFIHKLIWFGNDYEEGNYRFVFVITDNTGEKLPFDKRITSLITVKN